MDKNNNIIDERHELDLLFQSMKDQNKLVCSKCKNPSDKYVNIITGENRFNMINYLYCILCFKTLLD